MLELTVTTKMRFSSISDFDAFTKSPGVHSITGFPRELRQAYATRERVVVTTLKPPFGEVTISYIEVKSLERDEGN